eukprot:gene4674-3368_t
MADADARSASSDVEKPVEKPVFHLDIHAEVIDIPNVRLFSFDEINLHGMDRCTNLLLRKNLLHKLTPFPAHLAERLEELDLFDNKIKKIGDFFESEGCPDEEAPVKEDGVVPLTKVPKPGGAFPHLVKLDLSYNQIKNISGLDTLGPCLKELYLVENKIKHISGLEALVNLELLELGGNQISSIGDALHTLRSLKQLWLGKNKISSIGTSLVNLHNLELLSLQANRIVEISPESFPEGAHPNLKEAFFSENGIEVIQHLPLHALHLLDFSFNPITIINEETVNVTNFPELEEFWVTDGKIKDWGEVEKLKPFSATLRTVYLERNPIEDDHRYRDKVHLHLPFVTQIDSWPVVNKGNLEADRSIQRKPIAA